MGFAQTGDWGNLGPGWRRGTRLIHVQEVEELDLVARVQRRVGLPTVLRPKQLRIRSH